MLFSYFLIYITLFLKCHKLSYLEAFGWCMWPRHSLMLYTDVMKCENR